tara:strand:+ start:23 stop:520 length:498 start_codon:yes stop_codon:yes gene_type:complete
MSGLVGQVGSRSGVVGSTTNGTQLEYEVGTWTPTMQIMLSTGGVNTVSGVTGGVGSSFMTYTRIGKICHVKFSVQSRTFSASLTNQSAVRIHGLPFVATEGYSVGSLFMQWDSKFTQENVFVSAYNGNSYLDISHQAGNSNWASATYNQLSSGTWGGFNIAYTVE